MLLERPLEILRPVGGAEPAPGDEVRARRDGRGQVDLEQRQLLNDLEQVGWARCVEQLRAHHGLPGLRFRQACTGGRLRAMESQAR
jgi:hypothetical protein